LKSLQIRQSDPKNFIPLIIPWDSFKKAHIHLCDNKIIKMNNIVVITKTELVEIIQETLRSAKQDEKLPDQQNVFLNMTEASDFLKMAKQTLYGLTSNRKIPFIKKGKKVYFNKGEVIAWLNEGKMKTKAEILKAGFK
jgi:excisionase family DNA binding protein